MPPVIFPPCPPQLKSMQHYIKLANDYEDRNSAISYWARLYVLQSAMKIDKSSTEAKALLISIMDYLEKYKKENVENEGVTSDVAGQALVENEAHKLFTKADSADRQSFYDKNIVKAFYTAGILMDVCEVFGELTDEIAAQRKYSKWKATYIHNCLKNGETPVPGPIGDEEHLTFELPQAGISLPPPFIGQDSVVPPPFLPSNFPPGGADQSSYVQPSGETPVAGGATALPPSSYNPPEAAGGATALPPSSYNSPEAIGGDLKLTPAQFSKAQKNCKYAISSMDYEDTVTAISYLQKALQILTTGRES